MMWLPLHGKCPRSDVGPGGSLARSTPPALISSGKRVPGRVRVVVVGLTRPKARRACVLVCFLHESSAGSRRAWVASKQTLCGHT